MPISQDEIYEQAAEWIIENTAAVFGAVCDLDYEPIRTQDLGNMDICSPNSIEGILIVVKSPSQFDAIGLSDIAGITAQFLKTKPATVTSDNIHFVYIGQMKSANGIEVSLTQDRAKAIDWYQRIEQIESDGCDHGLPFYPCADPVLQKIGFDIIVQKFM